ncbi:hypothetical protein [Halomarina rubra]|uniref:ATP-grasp domain-containing protein n=1 Tax=Halomarina rubra TaxID=2071873 RepID=A0ABD6B110_9EURY|nr:hypothetical protein [Halomarina rubra]
MVGPVSLYPTDFADERSRLSYYWSRLSALDVPVPETEFVALEETDDAHGYAWDTDAILAFMADHDLDRAFVRTERKAATVRLREGSFVSEPTPEVVDDVVSSLLSQNDAQWWPHGGGLVVREWLDLAFCPHPTHGCRPSVRFFVDDGAVLGQTPASPNRSFTCGDHYDYLAERLDGVSFDRPRAYAERIAPAFPEATWAVDFDMATDGTWYCTEFNFNGVYWNRHEERWWNMAGQGDNLPFSPVEMHSAALWGVRPEKSGPAGRFW